MSIFCIGQSAYDITVPIDRLLMENQKYRVETFKECGGGSALNAACLCAVCCTGMKREKSVVFLPVLRTDFIKKLPLS